MEIGHPGLNLAEWHDRYRQQGNWSEKIRKYLFTQAQIEFEHSILEVGSGTGAILGLLKEGGYQNLIGVDINIAGLKFSKEKNHQLSLVQGDGFKLPFKNHTFDVSLCHFLLLWVLHPHFLLTELLRVTRPDGFVLALAEPDHEARIDYPPPLDQLGKLQTQSLQDQGVDTQMGRKLRGLFHDIGLLDVQSGILGAQSSSKILNDTTEWSMLESDLTEFLNKEELSNFKQHNTKAWTLGRRVLFVPTFYAMGKVPE